jgi:hypothetical protein
MYFPCKGLNELYVSAQLDCPAALERIKEDRPITIKDDKGNTSKCIADIVSVSTSVYRNHAVVFCEKQVTTFRNLKVIASC